MRALMLLVCLVPLSLLLGTGVLGVLCGRQAGKLYMADRLITGLMTVVGMAEIAHLAAVFLARSFAETVILFVAGTVLLALVSLGICLWMYPGLFGKKRKKRGRYSSQRRHSLQGRDSGWSGADITPFFAGVLLVFMLLVIYQIVTVMSGNSVYRSGDMTVETVESFLETDGIYQVNPLTGQNYELGVPLRIRILCLPTLYGILCRIFGLQAVELVWRLVPIFVLFLCYLAFWTLAKALFVGEKDREKRLLFLTITAAVICVGDYLYGMDGFGLLHCGYRGVTIRNMILMPYIFGLALRHRWRPVFLCILAEACLVWTLYGMGACLLAAFGMGAVRVWQKRRGRTLLNAGEEA